MSAFEKKNSLCVRRKTFKSVVVWTFIYVYICLYMYIYVYIHSFISCCFSPLPPLLLSCTTAVALNSRKGGFMPKYEPEVGVTVLLPFPCTFSSPGSETCINPCVLAV